MRAHGRREMGACGCCNGSTGVPMLRTMIGGSERWPQMIGAPTDGCAGCDIGTTVPGDAGSVEAGAGAAAGAGGAVDVAITVPGVAVIAPGEGAEDVAAGAAGAGIIDENHAEIAGQFS
jgi:hypothetical protein